MLAAARCIPESRGVPATGAPADPAHVTKLLGDGLADLESKDVAEITLAGRSSNFGKRFLDGFARHCQPCEIAKLQRDLPILHAPSDEIVPLDNVRQNYEAAKHPKNFLALAGNDHLLSKTGSAEYAARIITARASRLVQGYPSLLPSPIRQPGTLFPSENRPQFSILVFLLYSSANPLSFPP